MRIACWITKATNILSEYVVLTSIAFSQQQWLRERSSMLRHMYIACLVKPRRSDYKALSHKLHFDLLFGYVTVRWLRESLFISVRTSTLSSCCC